MIIWELKNGDEITALDFDDKEIVVHSKSGKDKGKTSTVSVVGRLEAFVRHHAMTMDTDVLAKWVLELIVKDDPVVKEEEPKPVVKKEEPKPASK